MSFMLDTDICIYVMKMKPERVLVHFRRHRDSGLVISAITLAELEHGMKASAYPAKNTHMLYDFLSIFEILPFGSEAAIEYGHIRADLQKRGALIGQMDLLIAAHAKSQGLTLVTNNTREFGRIEGLTVENWADA
jgi:tRNA(fMet)-specific endonuclease VapC